jgi:hypothetical protein
MLEMLPTVMHAFLTLVCIHRFKLKETRGYLKPQLPIQHITEATGTAHYTSEFKRYDNKQSPAGYSINEL